jgi:hypothetical protein
VANTVVVQADHLPLAPWERGFTIEALGTSVVRHPDAKAGQPQLRMYYSLRWAGLNAEGVPVSHIAPTPDMYLTAIAESEDGVTWTKPLLEACPFASKLNGANVSKSNILGLAHEQIGVTGTVWVEPSASAGEPHFSFTHDFTVSYNSERFSCRRESVAGGWRRIVNLVQRGRHQVAASRRAPHSRLSWDGWARLAAPHLP